MTQFAFLQPEFPEVFALARKAELCGTTDPRGACFHARLALEAAVKWMYAHDRSLRSPYESSLSALIHESTFRALVGNALVTKTRIIKDYGNAAAHDARAIPPGNAIVAVRELFHFSYWLVRTYARGAKPDAGLTFDQNALPRAVQVEALTLAKLQALAKEREAASKALEDAEAARIKSEADAVARDAEIARLQAEIAAIKQANAATPDTHNYNEAETRDAFIDLLLRETGWPLNQTRDREFPVTGMPNTTGDGFVDYVLWGDDDKPLGLVEAKRTKRDARVGQRQAELYADRLEAQFGQRPVIFYSSGYEHWLWDDRRYPPRPVQGFLKKDELELLIQRRQTRKALSSLDIDPSIAGRYYQTRAIRRIGEALEQDSLRKALLVMATGAGKTRTVIALADLLMRANWAKRILFLADRVALVNQATNAFKKLLPQAAPVNLVTDKDVQGRVYVSTYPTMVRLIDEMKGGARLFGPGHFDLIVIDEAHRSVYRKYRAIFDYFDSLLVGLTATPKDEIHRDTYGLFELQRGVPTDAYDLDQAVKDGFLVPANAISVPVKFVREGIRYDQLTDEEKDEWDAIEWDDTGAVPSRVEAAKINKQLFNEDTVDKVLAHLMTHGQRVADGDRLGKTIIFAKNHDHAQFITERFDANYPHLRGQFARVIDFQTVYAQSLIDDFSRADKAPHIAVSVDMLDTGIDIPEVVNLVFFKIVRSKTKFWQMIGRGTRLCPDLFGPGQHKECFFVFDFCQNFEFFNQNPELADGSSAEPLGKRLFLSRVDLVVTIDKLPEAPDEDRPRQGRWEIAGTIRALRQETAETLRCEVAAMNIDNFIVRPKRRFVEKYAEKDAWLELPPDKQQELAEEVAGLPSELVDEDIAAKQFDLLMLRTQLALLRADIEFAQYKARIMEIASALEELDNVPTVRAEMALIQEILTDEFWQDVTAPMLEHVRKRLRSLIKLIELKKGKIIYSDFEDEIGAGIEVLLGPAVTGTDMDRFRRKARQFLDGHADHITIAKLRRNEPLTATDLAELERLFIDAGMATADEVKALESEGGIGLFVRSLVGLDREAAKQAFAGFLAGRKPAANANQIEFVDMIIDYLTDRGVMEARVLYESPFTDIGPLGVASVFPDSDVAKVVEILTNVRQRTAA